MIIYPPLIGTTIPAFAGYEVRIPFKDNPMVNASGLTYSLRFIQYSDSFSTATPVVSNKYKIEGDELVFTIGTSSLQANQYYKFQIAYNDGDNRSIKTYSQVAIGLYLGNSAQFGFVGDLSNLTSGNISSQNLQITAKTTKNEPFYSFEFIVKEDGQEFEKSGVILNNINQDVVVEETVRKTNISYLVKKRFKDLGRKNYSVDIIATTINGYQIKYDVNFGYKANTNSDIGFYLTQDQEGVENGFITLTTEEENNYYVEKTKDEIYYERLPIMFSNTTKTIKDFDIEHGVEYKYNLVDLNGGISEAKSITPQFEHMFLSDGDRSLKIKYNPKVSSFKTTILENKNDTLQGQFPLFFRNGNVSYQEIPISGLISYQMDEEHYFLPEGKIPAAADEVTKERIFKLEVLKWLNNGQPKVFRSAPEGNYVVRLMNVSLSPNDTLGRRIHTFSATGYEVMEYTMENLKQNNLWFQGAVSE